MRDASTAAGVMADESSSSEELTVDAMDVRNSCWEKRRDEECSSGEDDEAMDLGSLYVMENLRLPGEFKIGRSKDPFRRARTLASGQNFQMKLVAIYPQAGRLEPLAHRLLAQYRVPGLSHEWFATSRKRCFSAISLAMDALP